MKRSLLGGVAVVLAVSSVGSTGVWAAGAAEQTLADLRVATARYHDVDAALADGYGVFTDAAGIACIEQPGVGAMGIHHANGALFADPAVNAATPEVLVYEPEPNGRLRLVAVEYVVVQAAWEAAGNAAPPALFGQRFTLIPAGNRYGLPPFYELHAWVWKHNPSGTFSDWNPLVSCAAA